jgi:hypothetical protein
MSIPQVQLDNIDKLTTMLYEELKKIDDVIDVSIQLVDVNEEDDYFKLKATVVVKLNEGICIYYEGIEEGCSFVESEEEFDECVNEQLNEYEAEYGKAPYKLRYDDGVRKLYVDVWIDDNNYKRCYYDVVVIEEMWEPRISYINSLSEDDIKELVDNMVRDWERRIKTVKEIVELLPL